jgi:hypothetical protein
MKAFTTLGDGIAALKREERPTPLPGRQEVLVKMTAAALNYRDLLLYSAWPGLRRFPARWLDYNIRSVVMIQRVCGGVPGWLGIACS